MRYVGDASVLLGFVLADEDGARADPHRLSAYDAIYLELAVRESLPLATDDAALAKAARARNVVIL